MIEEYCSIPGHSGYEVSNHGNIRSIDRIESYTKNGKCFNRFRKGRQITPQKHNKGYLKVLLSGVNHYIHRLVLLAFIGESPEGKPQARHLDGNGSNNKLTNLCWGSQADNENDKHSAGTFYLRSTCYKRLTGANTVIK